MNGTDFVLVRHGETEWHAENRYAGSSDIALTRLGVEQAQPLAHWAAHARPSLVVSSDLLRAVRTAEPAAEAAGVPLRVESGLREVHFGRGEGMTQREMAAEFPEALDRFRAAPLSRAIRCRRVKQVSRQRSALSRRCTPCAPTTQESWSWVVGAHSTLIRLVLCSLLDIPMDSYRRVFPAVHNVALSTVRLTDRGAALLAYNVPPPPTSPRRLR